jgi:hypothetical protein
MYDICNEKASIVQLVALNPDGGSPHRISTIIVRFMVHTHKCLTILIDTGKSIGTKCCLLINIINISAIGVRILLSMSLADSSTENRNVP